MKRKHGKNHVIESQMEVNCTLQERFSNRHMRNHINVW